MTPGNNSLNFKKGGSRGTLFREIARARLLDAEALLRALRFDGAIYLAGYAIECQLKFAVCERRKILHLPADFEIHDWDTLVEEASLRPAIESQKQSKLLYDSLVDRWEPSLRYRNNLFSKNEAHRLYKEMEQLYQLLKELVP